MLFFSGDTKNCVLGFPKECNYSINEIGKISKILASSKKIKFDFSNTQKVDFSFILFLMDSVKQFGVEYEILGANEHILEIFSLVEKNTSFPPPLEISTPPLLARIGKGLCKYFDSVLEFFNFFGLFVLAILKSTPKNIRFSSLMFHINNSAFKALPVGMATCFIVSAAITLQGVMQLEKMGMPLMSVETMAKLSLREMGPFILALVIAGRSASSFSAQIGVMRITEELDAMKVMGFEWFRFLVIPRFLALVVAMPLLVFLADAISLLASAIVIKLQTGISFGQYISRFYEHVGLHHFWVGVIKSPFFGASIALVGCYRGFQIRGDTQSVGKYTTISVVNALFWIIVINAIFSIIFTRFGI